MDHIGYTASYAIVIYTSISNQLRNSVVQIIPWLNLCITYISIDNLKMKNSELQTLVQHTNAHKCPLTNFEDYRGKYRNMIKRIGQHNDAIKLHK